MKRIKNMATIEITEVDAQRLLQALSTQIQIFIKGKKFDPDNVIFSINSLEEKKEMLHNRLALIAELEQCQDELHPHLWIKNDIDKYLKEQENEAE